MAFSRELFQQGMKHTDHREKDQDLGDRLYHSEHNCAAPPPTTPSPHAICFGQWNVGVKWQVPLANGSFKSLPVGL